MLPLPLPTRCRRFLYVHCFTGPSLVLPVGQVSFEYFDGYYPRVLYSPIRGRGFYSHSQAIIPRVL